MSNHSVPQMSENRHRYSHPGNCIIAHPHRSLQRKFSVSHQFLSFGGGGGAGGEAHLVAVAQPLQPPHLQEQQEHHNRVSINSKTKFQCWSGDLGALFVAPVPILTLPLWVNLNFMAGKGRWRCA